MEKTNSKRIKEFINEGFGNPWKPPINKIYGPNRWLYAPPSRWAWVPQDLKHKMLKQLMNHWMIGLAPKLRFVYNSWKKDVPTTKQESKIPFFAVICGSIDFLIWIKVEIEHKGCFLENPLIIQNSWLFEFQRTHI